jgi:hypothetical protein
MDLCTITGKITQHAAIKELQIRSLFSDIGPLRTPKAANSGPVVSFQLLHLMQKDIKRDTNEFMFYNDIWVSFVSCD